MFTRSEPAHRSCTPFRLAEGVILAENRRLLNHKPSNGDTTDPHDTGAG